MLRCKSTAVRGRGFIQFSLRVLVVLIATSAPSVSQERSKPEIIQASAMGTGPEHGKIYQVRLNIYEFSNEDDRKILIDAFNKDGNQGLINALEKMRTVGRIAIEDTLGFDVSYIRSLSTATGRKIRFVTNRSLHFGENYYSPRLADLNLIGGEINLDDQDRSKSAGILYPFAKLVLDKDKQLSLDLNRNPWKLVNIDSTP
jgi:hypothetical protein